MTLDSGGTDSPGILQNNGDSMANTPSATQGIHKERCLSWQDFFTDYNYLESLLEKFTQLSEDGHPLVMDDTYKHLYDEIMGCWLTNNATPFELPACLDHTPWLLKVAYANQMDGHCHLAILDGAHRLLMALVHLGHLDIDENSGVPKYRLFIHPSSSVGGFCHQMLVNGVPFMAKEGETTKTFVDWCCQHSKFITCKQLQSVLTEDVHR